jgi:predicted Zn-dependent protease
MDKSVETGSDGGNGMTRRPLLLLASLFAVLALSCSKISPYVANLLISTEDEVQLGLQIAGEIDSLSEDFPKYEDNPSHNPDLVDYINSLGQLIAATQDDRTDTALHWSFTLIDNDTTINAFACPGGFIYVYTGLVAAARNEAEIAGVLAHEIGHVAMRHGAETLVEQYGYDFVFDIIFGDEGALRTIVDVGTGLAFLKYSRDNEFQADSCSVEYLIQTGIHPSGMSTFLGLLESLHGSTPTLEFLSTHPPTDERIEAVDELIASKDAAAIAALPIPDKRYDP